eukprot:scaffold254101_cov18-Tisochrysis_lutea.AAC.2
MPGGSCLVKAKVMRKPGVCTGPTRAVHNPLTSLSMDTLVCSSCCCALLKAACSSMWLLCWLANSCWAWRKRTPHPVPQVAATINPAGDCTSTAVSKELCLSLKPMEGNKRDQVKGRRAGSRRQSQADQGITTHHTCSLSCCLSSCNSARFWYRAVSEWH